MSISGRSRVAIGTLLPLLLAGAASAGEFTARLRAQVGQEYDSNARREYAPDASGDFLTRLVAQGDLRYESDPLIFELEYTGGAKLFYHETDEHLMANKLQLEVGRPLADARTVGLRCQLFDTTQAVHRRDFFTWQAELFQRSWPLSWLGVEAVVGGQQFLFKPDPLLQTIRYSNLGPLVGLRLFGRFTSHWSAGLSYEFGVRFFDHPRLDPGLMPGAESSLRQDLRHGAGARVRFQTYTWGRRRLIAQLTTALTWNDSNSQGSSALWTRIGAVVSLQLPLDFTVHLMGSLQFTRYLDGLYLDAQAYEPDADENENSLVVRLSYRLWQGLALVLDGALYRNAFRSSSSALPPFARETLLLGVAYDWER